LVCSAFGKADQRLRIAVAVTHCTIFRANDDGRSGKAIGFGKGLIGI